jgi:hypothetical protein
MDAAQSLAHGWYCGLTNRFWDKGEPEKRGSSSWNAGILLLL